MSYEVFLVDKLGASLSHQLIFIRTNPNSGSGLLYHVIGSTQSGMTYQHRATSAPEESLTFEKSLPLGTVSVANLGRVDAVCQTIPPPKKQFQLSKRLYPNEPLRTCQEWASEAIEALKVAGVIEDAAST